MIRQVLPEGGFFKGRLRHRSRLRGGEALRRAGGHPRIGLHPGLANRLGMRYAKKVLVTFEDTLACAKGKGVFTGTPIRPAVFSGRRERGLAFWGLTAKSPFFW